MSSFTHRITTACIRQQFQEIEEYEEDKTTLKYIHSDCWCGEDVEKTEDLAITNCGHQCHKWCMREYLEQGSNTCFTCRQSLTTISNSVWGIDSIEDFLEKCEHEDNITAFMPASCLSRQITGGLGISRQITGGFGVSRQITGTGLGSIQDNTYDERLSKNGVVKDAVPLVENTQTSQIFDSLNATAHALHTSPFEFVMNGNVNFISTFSFIAPFLETDSSGLSADITIIIDISGSMQGGRLESCKNAIKLMLDRINGKSLVRVTIITFDDYAVQEFGMQTINSSNYDNIVKIVDSFEPIGGTNYNVSFRLLEKVLTNRDSIVFFFSDGEPSIPTDLSIMDNIYTQYPQLTMYVVSIGEDVDADKALIPLLRDRYHELGVYRHFPELDTFTQFIGDIIGETSGIYATNIHIRFEGVLPISSKCETNEDGVSTIDIPLLRYNDMCTFACTSITTENPVLIICEYTVNGTPYLLHSTLDEQNLLGDSLNKHFPMKRFLDRECNTIRSRVELTNVTKKEMLKNILEIASEENLGLYYNDFKSGLQYLIESYDLITTRNHNRNVQNILSQTQNRASSVGRQVSASASRAVSQHHHVLEVLDEDEDNFDQEF